MKKALIVFAVLGALTFITVPAQADFKHDTQQAITELLQQFYDAEKGNSLTIFSVMGLVTQTNKIFRDNIVIPKPTPKPDAPIEDKDKANEERPLK